MTTTDAVMVVGLTAAPEGEVLALGIDTGNSETVLHSTTGTLTMPSAVSLNNPPASAILMARGGSYGALDRREDYIASFDGLTDTFVGKLALQVASQGYTVTTGRGSNERYHDGFTRDLMRVAVAAHRPRATSITARIATGVPAKFWSQKLAQQISASWKGEHRYTLNGRDITLIVREVRVLAEGHAAWHALPEHQKQGTCGLLDIGGRTVNGLWLVNGVVQSVWTENLGVEAVLDSLSDRLDQEYRPLTLVERRELLDALREKRVYSITHQNKRVRVDQVAGKVFAAAAQRLVQAVRTHWRIEQADSLPVVGGGAYFHGPLLHELLPAFTVAARPELLNAIGYQQQLVEAEPRVTRGTRKG